MKTQLKKGRKASSSSFELPSLVHRNYVHISDLQRLRLVLMITEYGLTCYKAAKLVQIPYTNAKVIFRKFKKENRVIRTHRHYTGNVQNMQRMQEILISDENLHKARADIEK